MMMSSENLKQAIADAKAVGAGIRRENDCDAYYEFYLDRHVCPRCGSDVEVDSSQSNERDSSNDVHKCSNPKCDWYISEMGIWLYEAEQREKNKKL